jgi:hypothetical protein
VASIPLPAIPAPSRFGFEGGDVVHRPLLQRPDNVIEAVMDEVFKTIDSAIGNNILVHVADRN